MLLFKKVFPRTCGGTEFRKIKISIALINTITSKTELELCRFNVVNLSSMRILRKGNRQFFEALCIFRPLLSKTVTLLIFSYFQGPKPAVSQDPTQYNAQSNKQFSLTRLLKAYSSNMLSVTELHLQIEDFILLFLLFAAYRKDLRKLTALAFQKLNAFSMGIRSRQGPRLDSKNYLTLRQLNT